MIPPAVLVETNWVLDSDLQPWDKMGAPKPALNALYNEARIWVYGDFLVEAVENLPDEWIMG